MFQIPIELIRQYLFCPRIIYFRENLGLNLSEKKYYVKQGRELHEDLFTKNKRRTLSYYKLNNGVMHQNVYLNSDNLGIYGYCDAIIETDSHINIVEFKLSSSQLRKSHYMQALAYGLVSEEIYHKELNKIFISSNKKDKLITMKITPHMKEELFAIIKQIQYNIEQESFPSSGASIHQCVQCEYLAMCNDRE